MNAADCADLTNRIQAVCDDASHDEMYVTEAALERPSSIGCMLDGTSDENARRVEAFIFGASQAMRIWRANGGVGRMLVFTKPARGGTAIEASFHVTTGAMQTFALLRAQMAECDI